MEKGLLQDIDVLQQPLFRLTTSSGVYIAVLPTVEWEAGEISRFAEERAVGWQENDGLRVYGMLGSSPERLLRQCAVTQCHRLYHIKEYTGWRCAGSSRQKKKASSRRHGRGDDLQTGKRRLT